MRELVLGMLLLLGDVLFPQLEEGRRLGTLRLEEGTEDARGTAVPAGVYSLRYLRQPPLKDHVDTADHPDFAVLLPVSAERERWSVPDLVAAAREASGGHPWVLALVAEGTAGSRPVGGVGVVVRETKPAPCPRPASASAPCASRCDRPKGSC